MTRLEPNHISHTAAARKTVLLTRIHSNPPTSKHDPLYVGCVERGALCSALMPIAPQLAEFLFSRADEPGGWTALILQDEEVVLSATWQELISGTRASASASTGKRSERRR